MSQRRLELQASPDVAFERVQAAFASVGKVKQADSSTRSVQGYMRAGLGRRDVRVSVLTGPDGSSSVLEIQGNSNIDPYGYEGRALERFIAALGNS